MVCDKTFWPLCLAHDCHRLAVYVIGYVDAPHDGYGLL